MTVIPELSVIMADGDKEVKVTQSGMTESKRAPSYVENRGEECDISEKKLRRREQNRRAARRHRNKRRQEALSVIEDYKKFMSANTDIKQTVKQLEKEKELLLRILSQHREDPRCHLRAADHLQRSHKQELYAYSVHNRLENNTTPKTAGSYTSNRFDQQQTDSSAPVLPGYHNLAYSNNSVKCLYPNTTRSASSTVSSPPEVSAGGPLNPEVSLDGQTTARQPKSGPIPTVIDLIEDD